MSVYVRSRTPVRPVSPERSRPLGRVATANNPPTDRTRVIPTALRGEVSKKPSNEVVGKSRSDVTQIGNYQLSKKTLGEGNFAKVKLARHSSTSQQVAIKIVDKIQLSASSLKKVYREVRLMKLLNHPNIVRLYEVIETDRNIFLVMEYASGGELFDYLVAHGRMKEKEARAKFRQIVSAVQYCHQLNIVHRDLKAENLLLDKDLNIKIADFGFSNEFKFDSKLETFCGSPPYAAPELFQGKKYIGPEVDVWSLGVILYTLVSGSLPFEGHNLKDLRESVIRGKYRVPFYMSTECESLVKKLLILNPARRPSLQSIMSDVWINLDYSVEDRLVPYQPPDQHINTALIDKMVELGYNRTQVIQAIADSLCNDITATYMLLKLNMSDSQSALSLTTSDDITNNNANNNDSVVTLETKVKHVKRSLSMNPSRQPTASFNKDKHVIVQTAVSNQRQDHNIIESSVSDRSHCDPSTDNESVTVQLLDSRQSSAIIQPETAQPQILSSSVIVNLSNDNTAAQSLSSNVSSNLSPQTRRKLPVAPSKISTTPLSPSAITASPLLPKKKKVPTATLR